MHLSISGVKSVGNPDPGFGQAQINMEGV